MLRVDRLPALRPRVVGSQAKLAKALGVSIRTVSRWETGAAFPEGKHLQRLAEVLGVGVADLFGRQQ